MKFNDQVEEIKLRKSPMSPKMSFKDRPETNLKFDLLESPDILNKSFGSDKPPSLDASNTKSNILSKTDKSGKPKKRVQVQTPLKEMEEFLHAKQEEKNREARSTKNPMLEPYLRTYKNANESVKTFFTAAGTYQLIREEKPEKVPLPHKRKFPEENVSLILRLIFDQPGFCGAPTDIMKKIDNVVRDYLQAKADERNKVTDRKRAVSTLIEIKSLNQTKNADCEAYLSELRAHHRKDMIEKYDSTIKSQIARQDRHKERELKIKERVIVSLYHMRLISVRKTKFERLSTIKSALSS